MTNRHLTFHSTHLLCRRGLTRELKRANASSPEGLVAVQAILDSADDSVELVYAPSMTALGASASAGVESANGAQGTSVFLRTNAVVPGTSVKLTP